MKLIKKILTPFAFSLIIASCSAQVKNATTANAKINGNCGMCESIIEKSGNIKKVVKIDWDKESKIAIIIYDSTKTNLDEILNRIALSGYDNEKFSAPDEVYLNLHGCCQYEREKSDVPKAK